MVWRCACGLDISLRLSFVTFFAFWTQVIFETPILSECIYIGYLVWATPPTVLCRSFWNFTGVFAVVWRCACGLNIILRLFFIIFSHFQFSHFSVLNIIKVFRYWVLGAQLHLQFLCQPFSNCPGLTKCMWFSYNPQITFFFFIDSSYS